MPYLFGIIAGLVLPVQTSINTKLKNTLRGGPFFASMVSFVIGTLSLLIVNLIEGNSLLVPVNTFTTEPVWIWFGGALGVVGLTANIIIFPYLGAVQTVVMPILGQILMGMLIDNFGLFAAPVHHFTLLRLLGIIILLAGIFMIVIKREPAASSHKSKLPWQLIGLVAGMFQASQAPINGHLGILIGSPTHAALISFFVGAVILLIIGGISEHGYQKVKNAFSHGHPWWVLSGGALGAIYVLANADISPIIGAGTAVILALLGNLFGSVIFDKYGIMGASKKHITIVQYLGIVVMFLGVVIVKLF
ncbi:DMT family transporter [Nicoliella spurrieriana]|uniref:DMT family transporter n=1 Tax=Nicoliella spurrieriana TaxID=2925830 RepID=A0A976RS68_9LACO|nr:DMT family transporter [Nicoliella spurrieriana]UQS86883.1 DMT family transporter [Nicoliella spurrieriana]